MFEYVYILYPNIVFILNTVTGFLYTIHLHGIKFPSFCSFIIMMTKVLWFVSWL